MLHLPDKLKCNAAPSTFGLKRHGTLTAAQWYNICCFNIFVTLSRVWGHLNGASKERQWLQNYWHLCSFVRISHLHSLQPEDITRFRFHAQKYITGFERLFPMQYIRPSHHYLLHLADQMEYFGAMPGRWAFPLERRNGRVQRINTNHKLGESRSCI
jgi:hypothetical protein